MSNSNEFINLNKFEIIKEVARGQYGIVFTIQDKETGVYYAAKISKEPLVNSNKSLLINLKREVNLISQLNHPAILKFIGYSPIDFDLNPKPVIITEYSKIGSLDHLLNLERKSKSPSEWDDTQKLINLYGIASAMSYLHSNDIIHRDLKPENILENDFLNPLIADFGLSKSFANATNTVQSTLGIKGTLYYIPPEVYVTSENTKEGDVYAFSMIVYEMMTLEEPFKNFNGGYFQLMEAVGDGQRPEFDKPIPERYKKLIVDCWSQKPENRPTFSEIVSQLKNDKDFITDTINKEKFNDYVELIENSSTSFDPHKKFDDITFSDQGQSSGQFIMPLVSSNELVTLTVKVIEAKQLMQMNFSAKDNPYIKLRLRSQKVEESIQTKTKKETLNPVWNEEFTFIGVNPNDYLIINMYDGSIINGYKMMNEIQLPISSLNEKVDRKEFIIQYKEYKNAGKLYLGLNRSNIKRGHIKIHVFEAKDLIKTGVIPIGKPNPMMSFGIKDLNSLLCKTNTYFENTDPVWNQDFVVEVPDINTNVFVISLFDKNSLVYKKEVKLSEVQIGKKNVYNEKIFIGKKEIGKKEIGTIHYGYELCLGYPKQSTNEKKIYTIHIANEEKKFLISLI